MECTDFSYQRRLDDDIVLGDSPRNRLYLCIPHERYGYACYLREVITHGDLNRYGVTYVKVRRWYPKFLDRTIVEWNLGTSARIIRGRRN